MDKSHLIEAIFGVVEIICGIFIIMGLFTFIKRTVVSRASLIIFLLWAARIVFTKFIWGIKMVGSKIIFYPSKNIFDWLLVLSCELIILASLYLLFRVYED